MTQVEVNCYFLVETELALPSISMAIVTSLLASILSLLYLAVNKIAGAEDLCFRSNIFGRVDFGAIYFRTLNHLDKRI